MPTAQLVAARPSPSDNHPARPSQQPSNPERPNPALRDPAQIFAAQQTLPTTAQQQPN
ncbi:hypothetical protein CDL15_Pgr001001 [Punica granatum]|uniref:Uncharacterized protein n=1 Tax=Punica granatum TaxID=22663 RepID=A0A218XJC4_PUNGR|nr:hypothetical protein CDL15_Pgr001001 [Punica granatum]